MRTPSYGRRDRLGATRACRGAQVSLLAVTGSPVAVGGTARTPCGQDGRVAAGLLPSLARQHRTPQCDRDVLLVFDAQRVQYGLNPSAADPFHMFSVEGSVRGHARDVCHRTHSMACEQQSDDLHAPWPW